MGVCHTHVHRGTHAVVCMCGVEDSLWKLILCFHHVGPGNKLRLSAMVVGPLYRLSFLTSLIPYLIKVRVG